MSSSTGQLPSGLSFVLDVRPEQNHQSMLSTFLQLADVLKDLKLQKAAYSQLPFGLQFVITFRSPTALKWQIRENARPRNIPDGRRSVEAWVNVLRIQQEMFLLR